MSRVDKSIKISIKEPIRYVLKYNVPEDQRNKFQNSIVVMIEKLKDIR